MLDLPNVLQVLALERALGGRRYGHFDHDAANVEGPCPPSGIRVQNGVRAVPAATSYAQEFTRDQNTGEYLPAL